MSLKQKWTSKTPAKAKKRQRIALTIAGIAGALLAVPSLVIPPVGIAILTAISVGGTIYAGKKQLETE